MCKVYYGQRKGTEVRVFHLQGTMQIPLESRNDLRDHSPDGFQWGYAGSGPAQLALALLCHATKNDLIALHLYQRFKQDHVSRWSGESWSIRAQTIIGWVLAELAHNLKLGDPYDGDVIEEGGAQ
jgi:hypothetical protein